MGDNACIAAQTGISGSVVIGKNVTIGGQAGFAGITDWFRLVDISDLDFMPHCDAVYKLSIAFKDWYRKDSGTFHFPFGQPRFKIEDSTIARE